MTVAELIYQLQKFDPLLPVMTEYDHLVYDAEVAERVGPGHQLWPEHPTDWAGRPTRTQPYILIR